MRVGLITYQIGHRKTLEITQKLLTRGHSVTWFAFPFKERPPKPLGGFPDRPPQIMKFDTADFCKRYGVSLINVPGWMPGYASMLDGTTVYGNDARCEVYLHCTAKIIPAAFIFGRTILNCHPGLLPKNRGVDALKWSIVNGWPIGVTLHKIDEEIDRGTILFRRVVPILSNDTLQTLCQRAYDFECDMLANFDAHLHNLKRNWQVGDGYPISHKRIPAEEDDRLEETFLANRSMLADAFRKKHVETYPE